MTTTTFQQVAHHYLTSGIMCHFYKVGKTYKDGEHDGYSTLNYTHLELMKGGHYRVVPVLRHIEDMTEAEAQELWTLGTGEEWVQDSDETALQASRMSLGNATMQFDESTTAMSIAMGNPSVWNWLCSKGFDLFGLIESGLATRKEIKL